MTTLDTRTAAIVDQVVDRETYSVVLDLGPLAEQILRGIADALTGSRQHVSDVSVGRYLADHLAQTERIVAPAFLVTLTPRQAGLLAEALDEAAAQPEPCAVGSCERLSALGDSYCALHGDLA